MTAIEIRYGNHLADRKYGRSNKSSVAYYVLSFVGKSLLKSVKHVINRKLFDDYEGLKKIKGDYFMKNHSSPIPFKCSYN